MQTKYIILQSTISPDFQFATDSCKEHTSTWPPEPFLPRPADARHHHRQNLMVTATRLFHRQFRPNHPPHIHLSRCQEHTTATSPLHSQGACTSTSTAASLNHRMHGRTEEHLHDTLSSPSFSTIGTSEQAIHAQKPRGIFYRHCSGKTLPPSPFPFDQTHSHRLSTSPLDVASLVSWTFTIPRRRFGSAGPW